MCRARAKAGCLESLGVVTVFTLLIVGCLQIGPVQVDRVIPDMAEPGDIIYVSGNGFGPSPEWGGVLIGTTEVPAESIVQWDWSGIRLRLPSSLSEGASQVEVTVMTLMSNPYPLTIVPKGSIKTRVIAFGDSLTWGQDGPFGSYASILERLLNERVPMINIVNAGQPGETTTQGLERFEETLASWDKLDCLLLLEGTNDVSDTQLTPLSKTVGNLREMIRIARHRHTLSVVMATPLPRQNNAMDLRSPTTEDLVQAIRGLAKKESIPLVDLYARLYGNPFMGLLYTDDIHPGALGNAVTAEAWMEVLQSEIL